MDPALQETAAIALLDSCEEPAEVLDSAMAILRRYPHHAFRLRDAPLSNVRRLLLEDGPVSHWALENEWYRPGGPRAELDSELEYAAGRASMEGQENVLQAIWKRRPHLFAAWLRRYVAGLDEAGSKLPFETLNRISQLSPELRLELLRTLERQRADGDLISALVGGSPDLYRVLLQRLDLSEFATDPLEVLPTPDWGQLALVALEESDLGERGVMLAAFQAVAVFDPRDSTVWQPFVEAFDNLRSGASPELTRIATQGAAEARNRIAIAQERQRNYEMTGDPFSAI